MKLCSCRASTYWKDPSCVSCCCCSVYFIAQSRPTLWQPHGLLCPWDSPGKNTAVGCHLLLQGIFPDPGTEPGSLSSNCGWVLYRVGHPGSPCSACTMLLPRSLWLGISCSLKLYLHSKIFSSLLFGLSIYTNHLLSETWYLNIAAAGIFFFFLSFLHLLFHLLLKEAEIRSAGIRKEDPQ